jgi:hypothetical protein
LIRVGLVHPDQAIAVGFPSVITDFNPGAKADPRIPGRRWRRGHGGAQAFLESCDLVVEAREKLAGRVVGSVGELGSFVVSQTLQSGSPTPEPVGGHVIPNPRRQLNRRTADGTRFGGVIIFAGERFAHGRGPSVAVDQSSMP